MMDVASKDSPGLTEDVIAASLSMKAGMNDRDSDSVSLGSETAASCDSVGTLSGISTCSAFSLTTLMKKKMELIQSIRSQLNSSSCSDDLCTPNTSAFLNEDKLFTSTPYKEIVPPAAKYAKNWRCFSNIEEIDERGDSTEKPVEYDEAFESLKDVLDESDDMLGKYESALEVYKINEDMKLKQIKSFFEEDLDNAPLDCDTTITNSVAPPEEDKLKDDNDNTIVANATSGREAQITVLEKQSVENKEKTTTELLDLKDPENAIIAAEEDVAADLTLVDEERLLASDDDEPVAPAPVEEKRKTWTEFISDDPDENRDNNDPRWEQLRNLGSDYERCLAVSERWRNIEIPNPKKDLTCRCRPNMMNTAELRGNNNSSSSAIVRNQPRKRPHSPTLYENNKKPKAEAVTMLFDRGISYALQDINDKIAQIQCEEQSALNHLADNQRLDQIQACHRRLSEREMRSLKNKHYRETYDLMGVFRERKDHVIALSKKRIAVLRQAASEVREFYEFYPLAEGAVVKEGKDSLIYLSSTEVEEILELESMFMKFEKFYASPA